jgi:hypothetical protein
LGQDTWKCDASFPLCRLQLNSLKVTLGSVASITSSDNQVEANITPLMEALEEQIIMRTGLQSLKW